MTKNEFVEKVKNACEMMFTIRETGFTICEEEQGFSIAQWDKQETEVGYEDAESMVNSYMAYGKPIGEQTEDIIITDYTGY